MKKILIIMTCAAVTSIVVTLLVKSLGVGSPAIIGGGVGGAVAGVLAASLNQKK